MRAWTCGVVVAIGLMAIPDTTQAQTQAGGPADIEIGHIRSHHAGVRAMVATASEQSPTFHRMVETINAGDGIVYIERGECKQGVRACLVKVIPAGGYRLVFIKVDIMRAETTLMAAIGHELRHAIEVLSDPAVRDYSSMVFFYRNKHEGVVTSTTFETKAAREAGAVVADEIGRFRRAR